MKVYLQPKQQHCFSSLFSDEEKEFRTLNSADIVTENTEPSYEPSFVIYVDTCPCG